MATATITITLPTTRTDGSPLTPDQIDHTDIFDLTSPTPDVAIGTVKGAGQASRPTFSVSAFTTSTWS